MKILIFNEFTSIPGGVDSIVNLESKELAKAGVDVILFYYHNSKFKKKHFNYRINILLKSLFGKFLLRELQAVIDNYEPDIIHFHNIYQLFGTPIWSKINQRNAKIVLHLHNYYPFCLSSFICFRNNFCTRCISSQLWISGVIRKCYNNSFLKSFCASVLRISPEKWFNNLKKVSLLIAVSSHCAEMYKIVGTPFDKIIIIPNAIEFKNTNNRKCKGKYILYLGNIREEKGITIFIQAALNFPYIKFIAVGDGPSLKLYKRTYSSVKNLIFTGYKSDSNKIDFIRKARFLFFPTLCFETFGIIIIEAYRFGIPVLTTAYGGIKEILIEGKTGRQYRNLNSVIEFWMELGTEYRTYKKNCEEFSRKYFSDEHIKSLMAAYRRILN